MRIESFVRFFDELLVEAFLTRSRFVASYQQNRVAFWIEGESNAPAPVGGVAVEVSIRAPAWGATGRATDENLSVLVSIRAPAWGATPSCQKRLMSRVFQSAPPRGGRPK
jgi:hypothetical protein